MPTVYGLSKKCRKAYLMSSARFWNSSFSITRARCPSTVLGLMPSRSATFLFEWPSASNTKTSVSREVRALFIGTGRYPGHGQLGTELHQHVNYLRICCQPFKKKCRRDYRQKRRALNAAMAPRFLMSLLRWATRIDQSGRFAFQTGRESRDPRGRAGQKLLETEDGMKRQRALQVVLVVVGSVYSFWGYFLFKALWHSGWLKGHNDVLPMFLSLNTALGVCLLVAVKEPARHRSLIA